MSSDENLLVLQALLAAQKAGEPVVLAAIIQSRGSVPRRAGTKMLVYPDGRIEGTIGGGEMEARVVAAALECLQTGETRVASYALVDPERGDPGVCGGEVEIFLEPYQPSPTVFVIGCGHVGRAVAALAHWLGYRVVVNDDRVDLATPENIPDADLYLPGDIDQALAQFKVTSNTFIVLVTRNVLVDRQILPRLARTPAPYIGVMGSRRRWAETRRLLEADGLGEAELARIHSPLGLELNAESPAEIAVSILAEIIMLCRAGTGERMSSPQKVTEKTGASTR